MILLRILLISFIFVAYAAAAPEIDTVTGTISDGESIVIASTGTNFTTHADYGGSYDFLNATWNDFETNAFTENGWSISDTPENWGLVSSGTNRTNSSYYATKFYNNGRLGALGFGMSGDPQQVYFTFWFFVETATQSGKFARVYGDIQDVWFATGGNANYNIRSEGWNNNTEYGNNSLTPGTWTRIELLVDISTGYVTVWQDGVQDWTNDWVPSGEDFSGHTTDLGNMIDNPADWSGQDGSYNYDDAYVDYTVARVEIGNASTLSASTHREIQIPTAWSTSEITVTVNRGSFAADATAYLFVIDADGIASSGKAITFGEGAADTTAPTVTGTVIGTDGETVTITFDENVTGIQNDTFTLDCVIAGDPIAMTYSSGSGGTALVFTAGQVLGSTDSCTLDFDGDADDFEDDSGNDLVDFDTAAVTNNSTRFSSISIPGNLSISSGSLSAH